MTPETAAEMNRLARLTPEQHVDEVLAPLFASLGLATGLPVPQEPHPVTDGMDDEDAA